MDDQGRCTKCLKVFYSREQYELSPTCWANPQQAYYIEMRMVGEEFPRYVLAGYK